MLGVELDEAACETHGALVGPCDRASLWDYEPREQYDLVAGGIPCQSHSTAGKRAGTCDPRGQLYVPFLRIAQQAQARAVLIENVRPCVTATEHKSALAFGSEGAETNPRRCGDILNPALRKATGAVRLTVEQLAALQSFPPGFVFAGTKTQQHRQVGNAVPPPLAEAVGRAVLAALGGAA